MNEAPLRIDGNAEEKDGGKTNDNDDIVELRIKDEWKIVSKKRKFSTTEINTEESLNEEHKKLGDTKVNDKMYMHAYERESTFYRSN